MALEYSEVQKRIAFEIMRLMAEFDISEIQISPGHYNFYMASSEFPNGVVLNKQKNSEL